MPGETRALELSVSLGYFTGAGILCLFEESLDIDQKSSCLDKDSIQLDLGCILWVMLEVRSVFFFFFFAKHLQVSFTLSRRKKYLFFALLCTCKPAQGPSLPVLLSFDKFYCVHAPWG